jgi:hypothetical protein
MNNTAPARGFHLLDLSAIVVGYSMASLLVRAYWPAGGQPPLVEIAAIGLVFLWLGLAMSGPLVLLPHRPTQPVATARTGVAGESIRPGARKPLRPGELGTPGDPKPALFAGTRTWAEVAWLIIGFYWIGLTVLVVPVRLHRSPLHDSALIGLFPIAAAVILRILDRPSRRRQPDQEGTTWTHRAAVGLLLTWPPAWIALILLGKSLL